MYELTKTTNKIENAINSVTTNTSKEEVSSLMKSLQDIIKIYAIELGLLVDYSTIEDVKEFKSSLSSNGDKANALTQLEETVLYVNFLLANRFTTLAKSDIRKLLEGTLFKCKSLNLAIPQLKLYTRIEKGELSGVQCSITEKGYKLSHIIENSDAVKNAVTGLSYRLLTQEEYNKVVKHSNKIVQVDNGNTYSIRIRFYKTAIKQESNKYYKNLLNELTKEVADIVKTDGEQLSLKMFNIGCLEWVASKCVRDNRSVSFRALKSFDADTTLFNYVRCALFSHDELGLIK